MSNGPSGAVTTARFIFLTLLLASFFFYAISRVWVGVLNGDQAWWWSFVKAKLMAFFPGGAGARDPLSRQFYLAREFVLAVRPGAHLIFKVCWIAALALGVAATGFLFWLRGRKKENRSEDERLRGAGLASAAELRKLTTRKK